MEDPADLGERPEHYFTERPRSPSDRREMRFVYRGGLLSFEVDRGVFASTALDRGTALLIEAMDPPRDARVLDLGCGWGAIGVAAARAAPEGHVVLTDVNRRATLLARGNLRRNRIANAEVRVGAGFGPVDRERFDLIATNPPYHVGRPMLLALLGAVPEHLTERGKLLLVGKGSQGIRFYQGWLEERFSEVRVLARGGGYRVLQAVPPAPHPPERARPDAPARVGGAAAAPGRRG
ncbi:MAG TPA: methyltransferase [Thermoplasmata archaeon]|nr:methyltransferase [Thermoplasmata archaeon]